MFKFMNEILIFKLFLAKYGADFKSSEPLPLQVEIFKESS